MGTGAPGPVTRLLVEWGQAKKEALIPLVCDDLSGLRDRAMCGHSCTSK
jgi:hypothetical protein